MKHKAESDLDYPGGGARVGDEQPAHDIVWVVLSAVPGELHLVPGELLVGY